MHARLGLLGTLRTAGALRILAVALVLAAGAFSAQAVGAPAPVAAACNGWPSSGGVPPTGHDYFDFSSGSGTWSNGDVKVLIPPSYTCSGWLRTYTYNAVSTISSGHFYWIRMMTSSGSTTNCNYAGSGTDYMRQDGCGTASFPMASGAGLSQNTTYSNFGIAYASCISSLGAHVGWTTSNTPGANCGTPASRTPMSSPPKFDWTAPSPAPAVVITPGSHAVVSGSTVYIDGQVASSLTSTASGSTDTGGSGLVYGQALTGAANPPWSPLSSSSSSQAFAWTTGVTDGQTVTLTVTANDVAGNSSAAVTRTLIADSAAPAAAISFPEAGRPVAGTVAVTGEATDTVAFASYTLDFGAGSSPGSWTTVATGTAAVAAGGALGSWATGSLAAGAYTLRLRATDIVGHASTAQSLVYVDNTRLGQDPFITRVPFDLGGGWSLGVGVEHGDATLSRQLFSIPSYGPEQSLSLAYNSADTTVGALGMGWTSNLTQHLSFDSGFVVWHREDDGRVPFGQVSGSWTPLPGSFEKLAAGSGSDAGRYIVTLKDQTRLVFEGSGAGRLLRIDNRFGKSLTVAWGSGSATVTDVSGSARQEAVTFSGSQISSVVDGAGRTWSLGYNGSGNLVTVTEPDPDGSGPLASPVSTLGYDPTSHLLTSISRARRTAAGGSDTLVWSLGYTGARVTTIADPIANASYPTATATFAYGAGSTAVALPKTYSPLVRNTTTYSMVDALSNVDGLGRVWSVTDTLGDQTTQTWNPDSTIADVADAAGVHTAFTYLTDGTGNVDTMTADALGAAVTTKYLYNASNDVTETDTAYGTADEVATTEAYDSAGSGGTPGHLVQVTENAGGTPQSVTQYAYNAYDLVSAELDPKGITSTHSYDVYGNETQTVHNCTITGTTPPGDPAWKTCPATGTHDKSTNVTDSWSFTLAAAAGKLGLADSSTTGTTDTAGIATAFVYDALGMTTSETPPEGATTREWDQLGNEFRTTRPGSLVTTRTLDLVNRTTVEVAPGVTTTTVYDATGAVTSRTVAGDTSTSTYDGAGNLVSQTVDPGTAPHLNLTTEHAYDGSGRETAGRDPSLTVRATVYDDQGRVAKVIENCTNTATTVWAQGDPGWKACAGTGTRDATWNLTTQYTYDARGNKVEEDAPNGRVTRFAYDDLDRLVSQVDNWKASPSGLTESVTTSYAYDAAGRQIGVQSPTNTGGTSVAMTVRDSLGRAVKTIANCTDTMPPANWWACAGTATPSASVNVVTTYAYDGAGNQVAVTAPDPSATSGSSTSTTTTRYAYDAANRLCRVLENAGVDLQSLADPCSTAVTGTATTNVSTRYTYDAAGRLATMVDGNGHTTAYGYDSRGRMTSLLDASSATLAWAYDDGARTKTQTNRTDTTPLTPTITWTYDAVGRVSTRAYLDDAGAARTTSYAYTGEDLSSAADGSSSVSITTDRLHRPVTVTVGGDSAATTTYGYSFTAPTRADASGSYTMAVDPYGRVTSLTDPVHGTPFAWAYGSDAQVQTLTMPNGNSAALTYDATGRLLTKVTGARASYMYAYNQAGSRLTEASTVTGDPANGTATFTYDQLGRLTGEALPGITAMTDTWEAVPNRDSITVNGTPTTQTFSAANRPTGAYTFDADGRMTARPGSLGGSLEWDSLGRLARVRATPGGTLVAQYTYDALDRLLTLDRPGQTRVRFRYQGATTAVAQVADDSTGAAIRNVAVGPDGTVLEDWLGTSRRIYGTNGHSDTTWTADDTGAVTATLRYDPWGNLLRSTGSLPDWRFQGSWSDASTGLSWAVARWYDPVLGSFISEDSLLGKPDSPASRHLYAYGAGDPVNAWDPTGRIVFTFPGNRSASRTWGEAQIDPAKGGGGWRLTAYADWGRTAGAEMTMTSNVVPCWGRACGKQRFSVGLSADMDSAEGLDAWVGAAAVSDWVEIRLVVFGGPNGRTLRDVTDSEGLRVLREGKFCTIKVGCLGGIYHSGRVAFSMFHAGSFSNFRVPALGTRMAVRMTYHLSVSTFGPSVSLPFLNTSAPAHLEITHPKVEIW